MNKLEVHCGTEGSFGTQPLEEKVTELVHVFRYAVNPELAITN